MKVGLKISNPPDETINDIQSEEKLEEIISAIHDKMKQRYISNTVTTLNV